MKYDQNISPEELEQIEKYLQNNMNADEAASFAAKMQEDEEMRRKVNEVKLTFLGINEAVLTGKLQGYHEEMKPLIRQKKARALFPWRWSLAASVILLMAITTWWISHNANTNERIYSNYYKPDPGLMTLMSSGNTNYEFEKAMVEYKNGEYDKALRTWSKQLKEKPGNDTLLYFTGAAAQAMHNDELAIRNLQPVADNNQSSFQKDASWYLGLAYLEEGRKEKARFYIEKSENSQSHQLLKELSE